MNLLDKSPLRLLLISFVSATFIIYPNITFISWDLHRLDPSFHRSYILFFFFRYLFFWGLISLLLYINLQKIKVLIFSKRLLQTLAMTGIAYLLYVTISILLTNKADCFTSILLFQFFVVCLICTFLGHLSLLSAEQWLKEQEIEQLKIENLQSRFNALSNQINPHFFFNSLNGLTSLIRKKNDENTLAYVNKLSDVFRYILQSDKKAIVALKEELGFIQAFRYMLEVRFANKLVFNIDVDNEKLDLKIPVLSLLPVIENIVVHNVIDSEHKMDVRIWLDEKLVLNISNPVYPKLSPPDTGGTGLKNLESRFSLLMNRHIRVENDGKTFTVSLPLKRD